MTQDLFPADIDPQNSSQMLDHDAVCAVQAGQLLSLNCLEYETAAYGTAYRQNGEIYYYISSREDTILDFSRRACRENLYYTPLRYFVKRYDLMQDSEEDVRARFRLEVARQLDEDYPEVFFDALDALTAPVCDNIAFPFMKKLSRELENCFDLNHLHIFENLLEMLLKSRSLSLEGYDILLEWLKKEYEKTSVEPISFSRYRRCYSGFAYEKPDRSIHYFADGVYHLTVKKQNNLISKGFRVTPILTIPYYADTFDRLQDSRREFLTALKQYFDPNYITLINYLHTLPAGVDQTLYQDYGQKIAATGKTQAIADFRYYGYLWHIL